MKKALCMDKNLKKIGGIVVSILLIFLLATGCGTTNTPSNTPENAPEQNEQAEKQIDYPTRPITIIAPFGPGGGADQLARLLSTELEKIMDVSFPVVNIPGASGGVGMTKLITSPADGYTLYVYVTDTHATLAGANPSYKLDDVTPVARLLKAPSFLFVPKDSPIKDWAQLEQMIKDNPGQVKFAGNGEGSIDDIAFTYLEKNHGLKVNKIPYSNPGERYVSILGGHADVLYEQAGDVALYLNQDQMRPILVFNEERVPQFPDVPCTKELGMEVFFPFDRTILVKAGTPQEIVDMLSDALKQIYDNSPEFKKFLEANFTTPDSYLGSEDSKKALEQSVEEMKKAIQ